MNIDQTDKKRDEEIDKHTMCIYTKNMNETSIAEIEETRACHCLAARKHARELTRRYEAVLRRHGLKATQFSVLAALFQTGPIPITRLAGILGLERTTLTRVAGTMEKQKWLNTKTGIGDKRLQILSVTQSGKEKLAEAFPDWKRVQDEVSNE